MFFTRSRAACTAVIAALALPVASVMTPMPGPDNPNPSCPEGYVGPTNPATGCPWWLMH